MKTRKSVLSAFLAALLLCQVFPVHAEGQDTAHWYSAAQAKEAAEALDLSTVSTDQFIDWDDSQWWANRDSVKYAIGRGYMQGRATDKGVVFAGNEPVTTNEVLAILVRMCATPEYIAENREEAWRTWSAQQGNSSMTREAVNNTQHWILTTGYAHTFTNLVMNSDGLASETPYYQKNYGSDRPCPRSKIAEYICYALSVRGENVRAVNCWEAVKAFTHTDLYIFSGCEPFVGWATGFGIVTGDENGKFNEWGEVDRASMCEIIYRLDNPSKNGTSPREQAIKRMFGGVSGVPKFSASELMTNDPTNPFNLNPITIDMRTPEVGHRCPYAGDTVIRPDGTSVVLKFDEKYGILGWGQNCDPWTGTISGHDGHLYGIGEWGGGLDKRAVKDVTYNTYLPQDHLLLCLVGGEATKWEAHWSNEFELVKADIWAKVESGEIPAPTYEGQVEAGGLLKAYKTAGRGLRWVYMEHHKDG